MPLATGTYAALAAGWNPLAAIGVVLLLWYGPELALARRTAPGARFRLASVLDTGLPPCRAVVAVGEVLNYTQRSLDPVFRRVHRALEPGGLFVFDLAGPGRVAGKGPARYWTEGEDWAILVEVEVELAELHGARVRVRRGAAGARFAPGHSVVVCSRPPSARRPAARAEPKR